MNDTPLQPKAPKSSKRIIWSISIVTLLGIGVAIYAGFMWMQEKKNVSSLQNEVSTLTTKLSESASPPATTTEPPTPTTTSYKANIGKFTLTLPNQYVIIRNNDGPGEGGNSTILKIGKKNSTSPDIVESPIMDGFTISAFPVSGTTYATWLESELKRHDASLRKELSSINIDGVSTKVYQVSLFATERWIFFEKNNILYKIELVFESEVTLKMLEEVAKGLKFDS